MRGVSPGEDKPEGRCCGEDVRVAMSERGAFGSLMPPARGPRGGDCEFGSRGMGYVWTAGELYDDGGSEPDDARETRKAHI